ncbi:hypothetical protein F0562_015930 [Nyssa sinensis]|uniref:Aluminum-activated malate transporter n=1 Tax=Nyssa sinensis TaxID=561372 RepID=A0A5J4ZLE1_9ASTE|nr:hypothetical protein F0562_015930 [Nyssa sinensis]
MEIKSATQEKTGLIACWCGRIKALPRKFKAKVTEVAQKTKKIGQDDPRRIVHSLRVGLALTLVSMFYYVSPLYDGFGGSGMWAVLTVVVVFEFTVGATLSKGLNRGFATLLAGALGVGAEYLASLFGEKGQPIVLGFLVFLLAAASTFTRFFPRIKARYDYGVLIFVLTFSLVAVSGYRVEQIIELAQQRLLTIIVGGAICIIISIVICPVWAGEELHILVAANIEKLASFLEGVGVEYFKFSEDGGSALVSEDEKSFLRGYKDVLNTKTMEESLANFAWWEPGHGCFRFRHPWKQYLKIGVLARQCAYKFEALNAYINSDIQTPSEFQRRIQEPCTKISTESGKALKELASAIKTMTHPSSAASTHVENSKIAVDELKSALQSASLGKADLLEIIPAITVASILIEINKCIEKIAESIHELSHLAHFSSVEATATMEKPPQLLHRGSVKPVGDGDDDGDAVHIVIIVHGKFSDFPEKGNSDQAPKMSQPVEV